MLAGCCNAHGGAVYCTICNWQVLCCAPNESDVQVAHSVTHTPLKKIRTWHRKNTHACSEKSCPCQKHAALSQRTQKKVMQTGMQKTSGHLFESLSLNSEQRTQPLMLLADRSRTSLSTSNIMKVISHKLICQS
mmetsp:Transcript_41527/g.67265  ORF Transcript_41527/g.67265 Transcript_41527/m.67265 type:complete len:134 (-) Transcript_41527:986-1387(-)